MVNRSHPEIYVERILNLMPDDSKIRAKDLIDKAQKQILDRKGRPIGGNTLYRYLNFMQEKKYIFKINDERKKAVYYIKREKLSRFTEDMMKDRVDLLLKEVRKEFNKTISLELEFCKTNAPFKNIKEEKAFVNEIINEDEFNLTLGRILVKYGERLKRNAYKPKNRI